MNEFVEYIELTIINVNRAELILRSSSVSALVTGAHEHGFQTTMDGYQDVYMSIPWTAKKEGITEYVKLIFEFEGSQTEFISWLDNSSEHYGIEFTFLSNAKRGSIRQLKKPNPNPNKWFNRQWTAAKDYPTNIAGGFSQISTKRLGPVCLEVDCPLATDDIGAVSSMVMDSFPEIRLIEIAQGHEHAVDPDVGDEMNQATARLLFDISAVEENDYHALFSQIESVHSFIVPVMRVFTEPSDIQVKRIQWGI